MKNARQPEKALGFDGVAVTAIEFEHDGETYIITQGTGEGFAFAYLASDVEDWLDSSDEESRDYSEDFSGSVDSVETADLAQAVHDAALGWLGQGRVCTAVPCWALAVDLAGVGDDGRIPLGAMDSGEEREVIQAAGNHAGEIIEDEDGRWLTRA